jgi:hypothetical protein
MLNHPASMFDTRTTSLGRARSGHPETSCMRRLHFPASALALLGIALGGCAGDTNPVRDLAVASGVTGGEPKPAPDFVARTRPAQAEYVPIGVSPPRRSRAKDKNEVENAEAQMNQLSRANEARAAQARRAGAAP